MFSKKISKHSFSGQICPNEMSVKNELHQNLQISHPNTWGYWIWCKKIRLVVSITRVGEFNLKIEVTKFDVKNECTNRRISYPKTEVIEANFYNLKRNAPNVPS